PIENGLEAPSGEPDANRHRQDVDQDDTLELTEGVGQQPGAERDRLVGVDALRGRLAEEGLDLLVHERKAALTSNEDDLVDVSGLEVLRLQHLVTDGDGSIDERLGQLDELLA